MALTSSGDAGSQTAPSAGTAICSVSSVAGPGDYEVGVVTYQSGKPDANTANMQLYVDSAPISKLLSTNVPSEQRFRIHLESSATISIQAVADASSGAVYNGSLSITRIVK